MVEVTVEYLAWCKTARVVEPRIEEYALAKKATQGRSEALKFFDDGDGPPMPRQKQGCAHSGCAAADDNEVVFHDLEL